MSSSPKSPSSQLSPQEKLKKLKLKAFRKLVETDEFASHYAKIITEIGATDTSFSQVAKRFKVRDQLMKDDLLGCVKCGLMGDFNCTYCTSKYFKSETAKDAIEPLIDYYLSKRFEFISDNGTMSVPLMELAAILLFRSNDFNGGKPYYPIQSHLFNVTGFGSILPKSEPGQPGCVITKISPPNVSDTPTVTEISPSEMERILKEKKIMDDDGKKINLGYITLPGSLVDPNVNTADKVLLTFNPVANRQYSIYITAPRSITQGSTVSFKFQELLLGDGAISLSNGYVDEYTWTCSVEDFMFNYEKQTQPADGGRRRRKAKSKTKRGRSRKRLRMRSRTRKGNKKTKSSSRTRR
jgi:hypothetical protein